jgi:hypothetical protein
MFRGLSLPLWSTSGRREPHSPHRLTGGSAAPRFPLTCLALLVLVLLATSRTAADSIRLTLGASTLTFPDASPGTVAAIPANENPIAVTVKYSGNGSWVLTATAAGDLQSANDKIPATTVRWTVTGTGFVSGRLRANQAQTVASGSDDASGTLRFTFANSWTYTTGTYGQTVTFTAVSF